MTRSAMSRRTHFYHRANDGREGSSLERVATQQETSEKGQGRERRVRKGVGDRLEFLSLWVPS